MKARPCQRLLTGAGYSISNWPFYFFIQFAAMSCLRAFGQASSLAGFGRALAFLSDQPMCLTTKRGLYEIAFIVSSPLIFLIFIRLGFLLLVIFPSQNSFVFVPSLITYPSLSILISELLT